MLCRPRSRSRLLRRLRRPLRPLLSSIFRAAGVRGRKVPPRVPSVPCEGNHSPSVSVVYGHPAALRSSAAGSLPLRKSAVPQASQLTSSAPAPRYGFAVVIPGRYSSRPFSTAASVRSSLTLRSVLCVSTEKPSGQPGGRRSACWRRQCRNKSATDCAGRSVQGSIRCRERRTPIGQVSRSGSGRRGRLPSHIVGLFRCSREPKVSLPRRSRARRPHAARPPPRPRSTSFRALGHWETLRRASASRSVLTPTASPAPPSRLRDSQQPRPTRGTTPEP